MSCLVIKNSIGSLVLLLRRGDEIIIMQNTIFVQKKLVYMVHYS